MKINRFSNINEDDSIFDENWTEKTFDKINELKLKIIKEENKIKIMIKKYLLLNQDLQEILLKLNEDQLIIIDFEYYNSNKEIVFSISYHPTFQNHNTYYANLNREQFNDFLYFLKNPDIYINTKKYNI